MAEIFIDGGKTLSGCVDIHGAKNSALPIMAAAFLCDGVSLLHNVPDLSDVAIAADILENLGCRVDRNRELHDMIIDSSGAYNCEIPETLMHKMRSSVIFLGAVLAKCSNAKIFSPGGCELGPRPIDMHLSAMKSMGAEIVDDRGVLDCKCNGLMGCCVNLPFPSVGATENILIAAATASGVTKIHNAAREPEIIDLANYLNNCGAKISGAGESTITVCGVETLHGCEHTIIPDRIEAGTYMAAAAITSSDITINKIIPEHIEPVLFAFREAGCSFDIKNNSLKIYSPKRLRRIKLVRTLVYPGFPTDMLAPFLAMMTVANGTSMFIETIFQNRYKQVCDLIRMGACIKVEERVAVVEGIDSLYSAAVESADLRGGAALICAGLKAHGVTRISRVEHIDRGYENITGNFAMLGADIIRN